jgi:low affinity Fe/Cu permease
MLWLSWLAMGPFLHFGNEWHFLMGTVSASITLPMVFILARTQVKDTMSIQIKLNEIVGVLKGANNQLINIEGLSESKLAEVSKRYEAVAEHLHAHQAEHPVSIEAIVAHEIAEEIEAEIKAEALEHESHS